jgi:hypothetical protein
MTNLNEIAHRLSELFKLRKDLQIHLGRLETDLKARQFALIPESGKWPGANSEERKISMERAYAADVPCQAIDSDQHDQRDRLADLQAKIDGLQETASAERWRIRELMATRSQRLEKVEDEQAGDDKLFDLAAQSQLDKQTEVELDQPLDETEDDIPFVI